MYTLYMHVEHNSVSLDCQKVLCGMEMHVEGQTIACLFKDKVRTWGI